MCHLLMRAFAFQKYPEKKSKLCILVSPVNTLKMSLTFIASSLVSPWFISQHGTGGVVSQTLISLSSLFVPRRWEPEHGQWDQQPGAVPLSLFEKAGGRGCTVPDGSAAPRHPGGWPPSTHHSDEVCRGLWLQRGVRGRTFKDCKHISSLT